ncbi:glycosyltransferase family 2 protein [Luteipulveratus mongoliensis]|uniref:Glycosyltransferase 2-like domain-containing protein n=1 Tax=Luteipulveratus mongoliensis TaxID=571913 RepID=A0A0K1JH69_9MICO|nr:glycosyltransferase family 2 protein [Luteipulveratus mongoliensis]AKU15933.1 hypothetical protein VV02_08820 [Luteipulveratus mongoliensis]
MTAVPKVSVGLPVYNGGRYLEEALSSVLAQTHQDLEVVISDNGSTDYTQSICERFAALDNRVRYIRHETNKGAAFNHNFVVTAAKGQYFRWYAYDDRLEPTCLEKCVRVLDADPTVVLAWPQTIVIDGAGDVVGPYRSDLPWDNATAVSRLRSLLGRPTEETLLHMCYPVYGLIRREVMLGTGLLGAYNGADTVLLTELALRGRWQQIPEPLFYNRRHAGSSAVDKSPETVAAWFDPARAEVFPMPWSRQFEGYVRAVRAAPLSARERAACTSVLAHWFAHDRRWRVIAGELRIRARQRRVGVRGS